MREFLYGVNETSSCWDTKTIDVFWINLSKNDGFKQHIWIECYSCSCCCHFSLQISSITTKVTEMTWLIPCHSYVRQSSGYTMIIAISNENSLYRLIILQCLIFQWNQIDNTVWESFGIKSCGWQVMISFDVLIPLISKT